MVDHNDTAVKPVAEGQRTASKINQSVIETLAVALERADNPDVRFHLREAIMLQRAARELPSNACDDRARCSRCGARVDNVATTGPGEHVASCGCRVSELQLREIDR